jgi:NAD+ synthase
MTDSGRLSDPTTILDLDENELERTKQRISSFIEEITEAAGADGAVLGLSGGIDSTLTAYLAVEALGSDRLHGLVMPGTVSSQDNMSDAEIVATDLGIPHDVIEIEPIVDSFLTAYPEAEGDQLAVGNARARTRAVLNYLVANHEDRFVLGTGNRSEALVGYFTKFGDQAVDCNPIGNLYKCQVRALARHVGVPEPIIEKEPTAGLWAGQTDEEELGLSYEQLDAILALHVEGPADVSATASVVGVDASTVTHVDELVQRSVHKRSMPPSPDR